MGHYGLSNIGNFTATYKKYKETFIDAIHDLRRHSYIAKLKTNSSWYRTKSKATTAVKDTAIYIPLLYTTWDKMAASNMIHYQVQTILVYYLKANEPRIIRN